MRPHDIKGCRNPESKEEIESEIMHIQGAGAFARIELNRLDTREFIYAQLPKELCGNLGCNKEKKSLCGPAVCGCSWEITRSDNSSTFRWRLSYEMSNEI